MPAQAIQTVYSKHLFRSRLEARYAVFFDALGWDWQYEPEGFDLPVNGYYLPDFFITPTSWCYWPTGSFWLEVKADARKTSRLEREKLQELCCETQLWGFMGCHKDLKRDHRENSYFTGTSIKPYELLSGSYFPYKKYKSPQERKVKDFHTGDVWEEECEWMRIDNKPSSLLFELVEAAQEVALKARFEHGETPRMTRRILTLRDEQRRRGLAIKKRFDANPLFRP